MPRHDVYERPVIDLPQGSYLRMLCQMWCLEEDLETPIYRGISHLQCVLRPLRGAATPGYPELCPLVSCGVRVLLYILTVYDKVTRSFSSESIKSYILSLCSA